MRMRKLGNTGLVVSEVCLGTMTFSAGEGRWAAVGRMEQTAVNDVVKTSLERGVNFLDTANVDEIRNAVRMGILAGVTTNPTLMAKESGATYRDRIVEICELVKGPVSAECTSRDLPCLLEEGRTLASWHEHVIVKIAMDETGLEATSILSKEGIRINMTLVFSANQALLAASAGATFQAVSSRGKLKGTITATTPNGSLIVKLI